MTTLLRAEPGIGEKVGVLLYRSFGSTGVFGRTEMPEGFRPVGVRKGSLQHQLFITFTVAIDHQREANTLRKVSRNTFEDSKTNYLFEPRALHLTHHRTISKDMHQLGQPRQKDIVSFIEQQLVSDSDNFDFDSY